METNVAKQVRERIRRWRRGKIFFHEDFYDMGSPETTRKAVNRLVEEGMIRRYGRGIFYYPKIYKGYGEIGSSNWDLAEAIAKKENISLFPTECAAQNQVGLSTQNQMNAVYLTDGASRIINTGMRNGIRFIHTSDKRIKKFHSKKMQYFYIATKNIESWYSFNEEEKWILQRYFNTEKRLLIEHDIKLMTSWQRKQLSQILI